MLERDSRSIPLHNVWRGIQPMLYHQIQFVIQFRGGCTSSRVTSWRTGREIAVWVVSGGCAQGHTEECRIRVEGEIRKTEEGKARLRAAASRIGDAPTGRALKRVRFATDRVEDDAETPADTSASAPSSPPAEDAATNSLSAHPSGLCYPRLQSECLIK